MEVEWRRSLGPEETEDAVVWQRREVPWDNEGIDLCECDGIEEGVSYDVRVRGASEDAVPSDWDTRYSIRADIGTELPPPAPTGLRLEGGCLLWDFPRREDLAGFEVRHVEGENPDPSLWGLGVSLTPSLVAGPPVATCAVPGGRRVVMVKAVLASGIESAEAGVLSVFVGDFDASEPSAIAETDLAADSWASTTRLLGELDGPAIVGSELGEDVFWFEGTVEFWGLDDSAPWWDVNEAAPFWTNDAADSRPFWERGDSEQFWDPYFADLLWEGRLDLSTLDEGPENVLALAPEPVTSTRYWRAEYREESSAFWNRGDDAMPWWTTDGADFWATVVEDW
jgi:hypothetical protein